jgi:hypothetical protein
MPEVLGALHSNLVEEGILKDVCTLFYEPCP